MQETGASVEDSITPSCVLTRALTTAKQGFLLRTVTSWNQHSHISNLKLDTSMWSKHPAPPQQPCSTNWKL